MADSPSVHECIGVFCFCCSFDSIQRHLDFLLSAPPRPPELEVKLTADDNDEPDGKAAVVTHDATEGEIDDTADVSFSCDTTESEADTAAGVSHDATESEVAVAADISGDGVDRPTARVESAEDSSEKELFGGDIHQEVREPDKQTP